jgi:hypothetical protein
MVRAKRARTAETPKQTSLDLRLRASYFYPDQISWCGRLSEPDFLARLYDLDKLPSHDGRFDSMAGDIWQHRENNLDWDEDWVFSDSRIVAST